MYYYKIYIAHKFCEKYYIYNSIFCIKNFTVIKINFGKKEYYGVVIENINKDNFNYEIKEIIKILNIQLQEQIIKFAQIISIYNFCSIGSILELFLPNYIESKRYDLILEKDNKPLHLLSVDFKQTKKLKELKKFQGSYCESKSIDFTLIQNQIINKITNSENIIFLDGKTGSGKSVVASEIASKIFQKKKGKILIIAPEILLNKQWAKILENRLGMPVFIYHNKLSKIYKNSVYHWSHSDESGIVVGARSAMFLPFKNLSLIIIDEEHSSSLKQNIYPIYHAREMLIFKAKQEKIPLILISATPSLETYYKALNKEYEHYILPERVLQTSNQLFCIKKYNDILSIKTIEMIKNSLNNKNQILIFVNRKGYAPYCMCNLCKNLLKCKHCDQSLVFYSNYKVICHKCNQAQNLNEICGSCNKTTTWNFFGIGIEKVEKFIKKLFPEQKIEMITSDTKDVEGIVQKINNKEVDIILSTQILTQGHDFQHIELIVIVDADVGLTSVDFRTNEHILQLWQQIRGRSGRHNNVGKMIIQYNKDKNKFIDLFKSPDPYSVLLNERKMFELYPYFKLSYIVFESKNYEKLNKFIEGNFFSNYNVQVFGPLYLGKINNVYKFQFLIKYDISIKLFKIINRNEFEKQINLPYDIDIVYDIDI